MHQRPMHYPPTLLKPLQWRNMRLQAESPIVSQPENVPFWSCAPLSFQSSSNPSDLMDSCITIHMDYIDLQILRVVVLVKSIAPTFEECSMIYVARSCPAIYSIVARQIFVYRQPCSKVG